MSGEAQPAAPAESHGVLGLAAGLLAIIGGLLILGVAGLVTASIVRRWSGGQPIPGDFEFVQMATAVSVFAFLPYCQLRRGNIAVDTFTVWLPVRVNLAVDALWDMVYAATMLLLAWCLFNGTRDMIQNGTTTMVTGVAMWPAIALCTVLAASVALTACITAVSLMVGRRA
jgi:TRAP-type C4-dicarboxylate transport system permease small subunit